MRTQIPKNFSISLAALVLFQGLSFAHADITDLPDLSPGANSSYSAEQRGSVRIENISRKTNGEILRVNLSKALPLNTIEVFVKSGALKVFSTHLITTANKKIAVRELSQTDKLTANKLYVSENLNLTDSVRAIEIQAESYEAGTEITVEALSNSGKPSLLVTREAERKDTPEPVKTEPNNSQAAKPKPVKKAPNKPAVQKTEPKTEPKAKSAPEPIRVNPVVGKTVGYLTSWDRPALGIIKEIYENNMVLLTISSQETTVVDVESLFNYTSCSPKGTLCAGSRVLVEGYASYSPGKILGYFGEEFTAVQTDESPNQISFAEPETVTAVQSCNISRKICVGDSVVVVTDYSVYFGKAEVILPNGKITFRQQDKKYADSFEEETFHRAVLTNCSGKICVNDRVLFNDSYGYSPAKVIKVYDGTIVVIQKDGDNRLTFTTTNRLSKTK